MKDVIFELAGKKQLTSDTYELILKGDISDITAPGQFVNIVIDGLYLRRPISVCDAEGDKLTLIVKVVGEGTKKLCDYEVGKKIKVLSGLGNGFDVEKGGKTPVLVGGGVGTPPMYMLAKKLIEKGEKPKVVLGFADKESVIYKEEFEKLGLSVTVATVDGSEGIKGFVTDALKLLPETDYIYTCGPEPMLKALHGMFSENGQFSFEERMGCGFGACMGCSCKTIYGNKRICKDGPILFAEEIVW